MLGAPFLTPIASGVFYFCVGCTCVQISENLLVWECLSFVGTLWTKQRFAYEKSCFPTAILQHVTGKLVCLWTVLCQKVWVQALLLESLTWASFNITQCILAWDLDVCPTFCTILGEVSFLALMITKLKYWSTSESFWSYSMSSNTPSSVPSPQTRHDSGKNKQIHLSHKYVHLHSLINGKIVCAPKDCFRSFFRTYYE